jgi:hypothetical protein
VQIVSLTLEISEMERGNQSRMDQDNLQGMRLSLGCPDRGLHGDLEKCSDNIRRVFFHKAGSPKARANYTRMTLEKLKDEDCYQRWDTNAITKLLLVGGTTIPESRSGPNGSSSYSWLSPAAVDMASTLRKGNNRVAFFTCHPDTVTQSKTSLAEVIADTLFQIARCDPPMLRGEFFRHSSTNLLEVWKSQDDVEEMVQFAQRMFIIASAQHRLYLIIDRLDYCDSKPVNILKCLTSIIAPPSCNVKIFATWNTVDASIEKDCEYFIEVSKNAATGKMKFNQAKGHASSGHLGRQD